MSRLISAVAVCVIAGLAAPSARADEVIGVIWGVERPDIGAKWQFRAGPRGRVWTAPGKGKGKPEVIGTWSGTPLETVISINAPHKGPIGAKRKITIVLVGKKPARWEGEVEFPDGGKFPLTITLIKD